MQLAAMLRAGHPLDFARLLVSAQDADTVEEWAELGEGEQ